MCAVWLWGNYCNSSASYFVWECVSSHGMCDVSMSLIALSISFCLRMFQLSGEVWCVCCSCCFDCGRNLRGEIYQASAKNFYFHPPAKLHCFCNLDLELNKDLKGEIHQVAAKKSRPPLFSSQKSNKSNWSDSSLGIYLLVRWHLFSWRYFDIFLWVD